MKAVYLGKYIELESQQCVQFLICFRNPKTPFTSSELIHCLAGGLQTPEKIQTSVRSGGTVG